MSAARPLALVTGASSGIGLAFAEVLAEAGHDLVLVARRADRLHALAQRLQALHRVHAHVLTADLGVIGEPERIASWLQGRRLELDVLVNNAGYALPGSFNDSSLEDHRRWLEVMVTSPVLLTRLILPRMLARGRGRIINVASIAAFVPDPTGSLYNAAKSFMVGETRAIARDIKGTGVTVTAVCPGFTESEFHDVAGTRGFLERLPAVVWMDALTVARIGWRAAKRGQVVCVTGWVNILFTALGRAFPHFLIDALATPQMLGSLRLGVPRSTTPPPPAR